jgi:hypothetical protein
MRQNFGIRSLVTKGSKTPYMNMGSWMFPCVSSLHTGTWSVAAWPSVLSRSSILPPPSSHCTFIPAKKMGGAFKKCYYFILIILFFSNATILKLPTLWRGISKFFFLRNILTLLCPGYNRPQVFESFKVKCSGWPCSYFWTAFFQQWSPLLTQLYQYWCFGYLGYTVGMRLSFQTLLFVTEGRRQMNIKVSRIREVPVSNFAPKTCYSDWYFRVLTQSLHVKAAIITQVRPWILPSICGAIQYSLLVLPLTVYILHN